MTPQISPGHYRIGAFSENYVQYDPKHNYFYFSQDKGLSSCNLLMPASDPESDVPCFYIFNWESQNKCLDSNGTWSPPRAWQTESDHEKSLVVTKDFTGQKNQQFILEPRPGGGYYIRSAHSMFYLYESTAENHGHHCLRQYPNERSSKAAFVLHLIDAVNVPDCQGLVRNPELNPIEPPPSPKDVDDIPPMPQPVLLGETLLPFYQVEKDPRAVGNLRLFQVGQKQYYKLAREQCWKLNGRPYSVPPQTMLTYEIRQEVGVTKEQQDMLVRHTGFTLGMNNGRTAGVSIDGESESRTRSFEGTFEHDTTSTITITDKVEAQLTRRIEVQFYNKDCQSLSLYWVLTDVWSIEGLHWENPTTLGLFTSFPPDTSVTSDVKDVEANLL